jgi:hypothetical protein
MSSPPNSTFGNLPAQREHRVKFDSTISLGHVLTFVSLVAGGFGAYNGVDKRLTVLEEQRRISEQQVSERDRFWREAVTEIKIDVKDVQRSINDVGRFLSTRKAQP